MIKRKVKPFKAVDFSKIAQQKFIDVNTALQKNDRYLFRLDVCYSYVNIQKKKHDISSSYLVNYF